MFNSLRSSAYSRGRPETNRRLSIADATCCVGSSACIWPFIDCSAIWSCILQRLYHKAHTFVSQTLLRVCFILLQGRHGRGKPQYISKKTYCESAEADSR